MVRLVVAAGAVEGRRCEVQAAGLDEGSEGAGFVAGGNGFESVHDALAVAQAGDYRARHVTVGSRAGIVTPHRGENGQLDRNDLAAQIYALAHDLASDKGQYAGGAFVSGSEGYCIHAPDPDQE